MSVTTTSRGFFGLAAGFAAGVVSALLLALAFAHADSVLMAMLAYLAAFAALPLFVVGFAAGTVPALLGCLTGAVGLFLLAPAASGFYYLLADAIPAAVLVLMALGHRKTLSGGTEWASEGALLAALTLYPCLVFLGVYAATLHQKGGLLAMTATALDGMADQISNALAMSGQQMPPDMAAMMHQYLGEIARVMPALCMCAWLFSTLVSMALAQGFVKSRDWDLRPSFALVNLRLPGWIIFAAAATGLVTKFAPAPYDYVGLNLVTVLSLPFFFAGLAVIHAWAATTKAPGQILIFFYVTLSLISLIPYLAPFAALIGILVALLGAVDQWADFRKRFADRPPNS